LAEKITTLQNLKKISPDEFEFKIRLTLDFKELKAIYYDYFNEIFNNKKTELLKTILKILNSKVYYLDKLIWLEAESSSIVKKHLTNLLASNKANSKNYLLYMLSKTRPDTQKHKNIQLYLRIYT